MDDDVGFKTLSLNSINLFVVNMHVFSLFNVTFLGLSTFSFSANQLISFMITNNQVMTHREIPIHGLDGCKHYMLESGRNVIFLKKFSFLIYPFSYRDNGLKAIENLMQKKGKFDYILLETTGLADPGKYNFLWWWNK